LDPVLRWDGLFPVAIPVGLDAPTEAVVFEGTGTVAIVESSPGYWVYSPTRGNVFIPPSTGPDAEDIEGVYSAYLRFVDDRGNVSNLSPISEIIEIAGNSTIEYSNVQVTDDPKVVRRQLLRATAGQAHTYYVDIDTQDLSSTTFESARQDTELSVQEEVPIFDAEGKLFANRHNKPPNYKAVFAHHLGRMFAAVDGIYAHGSVKVTLGSQTVTGVGTEWNEALEGRFLYVTGAPAAYEIDSVDVDAQTLTLVGQYTGATDKFAVYAIRPAPAEKRLVYYSESFLMESWPPTNAFEIQENGDELTGLMPMGSFLFILERRHIHRFTYQLDPADDGNVFQASERGCINNRCWAQAEGIAYMLDEQGIHAFDGGDDEPISTGIQTLFRGSDPQTTLGINWSAAKWFHAAHFPVQETVRFFVALSGQDLPRHAIVYHYRTKRWWLEEYPVPIGASCLGFFPDNRSQVFLGTDARRVLALWQGTLDGPDSVAGTVRGTATSASLFGLTDSLASFASSGLAGAPIAIVSGMGKGQVRRIVAVAGNDVTIKTPWLVVPDTTSIYQIGGIPWHWQSGWNRFLADEEENERGLELTFLPVQHDASLDLRVYLDFSATPYLWRATVDSLSGDGVASEAGSGDLVVDLEKATGCVVKRWQGNKDFYLDGHRYSSVWISGFSGRDVQKVFRLTHYGVTEE
jgi:hypothetical protein